MDVDLQAPATGPRVIRDVNALKSTTSGEVRAWLVITATLGIAAFSFLPATGWLWD